MNTKPKLVDCVVFIIMAVFCGIVFRTNIEIVLVGAGIRPDIYVYPFYSWFTDVNKQEHHIQSIVDEICTKQNIKNCPVVKVFYWSEAIIAATTHPPNSKLFIIHKIVEKWPYQELAAVCAHELGHLKLLTADDIVADKFAAEIVGTKNVISALRKTREDFLFSDSTKKTIEQRIKTLESTPP